MHRSCSRLHPSTEGRKNAPDPRSPCGGRANEGARSRYQTLQVPEFSGPKAHRHNRLCPSSVLAVSRGCYYAACNGERLGVFSLRLTHPSWYMLDADATAFLPDRDATACIRSWRRSKGKSRMLDSLRSPVYGSMISPPCYPSAGPGTDRMVTSSFTNPSILCGAETIEG